jgi:YgiT-type zinc finger domain-containing protein
MDDSHPKEVINVSCSVEECPGEYEERQIVHTVRYHGQVVVIDHVPAEVCSVCGDVLLKPGTVRRIEELLRTAAQPAKTVPLYEYA